MNIPMNLRYYRHSLKTTDNNISPEGLELARAKFEQLAEGPFQVGFYGPLIRTRQTLEAMAEVKEFAIHSAPINAIGDNELFGSMVNDAFKAAVKDGKSNIEALVSAHNPEQIAEWSKLAASAVEEMFAVMRGREMDCVIAIIHEWRGIAVGHDPMVSLAARYFGWIDAPSLNECEHIDFVCDEDGVIRVVPS